MKVINMPTPPDVPESHQRPWILLNDVDDAEVWVANCNLELNFYLTQSHHSTLPTGQGVCFELELGGEIFLHTTSEGIILLDVSEDADWVNPIISSCTGVHSPRGQIWILPEGTLIQLVLGLNSLIARTSLVLHHPFGMHST